MGLIAAYHVAADAVPSTTLSDQTGRDLHLDAVFALLDRAESTIGQQLLYHRLRTLGRAPDLDAFEALSTALADDAGAREDLQLALRRLSDPAG